MTIHPDHEEAFQIIDAMMFSGCPSEEELARLEYFMGRWTREIPLERATIAAVEADLTNADDEELYFGNECTGEISDVRNYLDSIQIGDDNWVKGVKGKFKICAKVFKDGSTYGIKDGRISKIRVCDTSQEHWGFDKCYLNYDRGWDIRPNDPETIEFINGLLKALGDDELDADDLLYYSLYTYPTKESFLHPWEREIHLNVGERVHRGDFDSMQDAMGEGFGYISEENDEMVYAFKAISSDDEEIQIQYRGKYPSDAEK